MKTYHLKLFGNVDYKSCVDETSCCMSFVHLMFFNIEYSSKYLLLLFWRWGKYLSQWKKYSILCLYKLKKYCTFLKIVFQ